MNPTNLLKGLRPDITPLSLIAFLIAGAPLLCVLFGVDLSGEQKDALDDLLKLAIAMFGTDVLLRGARNYSAGKTAEAAGAAAATVATITPGGEGAVASAIPGAEDQSRLEDEALDAIRDDELPTDEEELRGGAAGVRPEPPGA